VLYFKRIVTFCVKNWTFGFLKLKTSCFARIGADKNEEVDLDNYVFFNKLFEVDNNLEIVENIVYENLEDLIDGLIECNVTKDYNF
jgi:hypothetical protein